MKQIIIGLIMLIAVLPAAAQQRRNNFNPEEFNRHLEAFIAQEAQLTPAQSVAFFKQYHEMNKQMRRLFAKQKKIKSCKPATEAACLKAIEDFDNTDLQIKHIQKRYHNRFVKLLGASKTYDVLQAEQKFFRRSFRRAAKQK